MAGLQGRGEDGKRKKKNEGLAEESSAGTVGRVFEAFPVSHL